MNRPHFSIGGRSGANFAEQLRSSAGMIDELAIMDESGKLLPAGESGEIVLRGPTIMKGYLNDPEATAEVQQFGWHHSGDVGYLDEQAYLFINDRKRDMIISGGFNIFPLEIEQVLFTHPCVQECAVVGVADDKWGEVPCAFVELKVDTVASEDELIGFCADNMARFKRPKKVVFGELPKTATGKIQKNVLRERAKEL